MPLVLHVGLVTDMGRKRSSAPAAECQSADVNDAPLAPLTGIDPYVTTDPDVEDFCREFGIDDKKMWKLSKIMRNRPDTFKEDMERLWTDIGRAKETSGSPIGLLAHKMWEMEEGTFVGKTRKDKELTSLIKKYALDELASSKLADTLSRYDYEKRCAWFQAIEKHLQVVAKPSAWCMLNLKKIGESKGNIDDIGFPGRPAHGSYAWRQQQSERDKSRDRGRGRSRSGRGRDDRGRDDRGRDDRGRDDRGR